MLSNWLEDEVALFLIKLAKEVGLSSLLVGEWEVVLSILLVGEVVFSSLLVREGVFSCLVGEQLFLSLVVGEGVFLTRFVEGSSVCNLFFLLMMIFFLLVVLSDLT